MDKLDTIVDAIEKRFMERTASKASKDAELAKEAKIKELEEKVAKLEAAPVEKKDVHTFSVGAPDMYKGFQFKKQFTSEPTLTPKDEKTRDLAVKEMLDIFDIYKSKGFITKAAMQVGTAGEGGNLVPQTWASVVEEKARLISVALQDCKRFPIINGAMNIPKTATGLTVTWADEEAASTESEPTVGTLSLTAKRGGFWGVVSQELLDDAAYDVVGYITREAVEALGQAIDTQVFNGTTFTGLLPSVTTYNTLFGTNGTSYSQMVAADWYTALYKIQAVRRLGAKWYLAKELLPTVQTLVSGTYGVPVMSYLGGTQTPTIAGYPYVEVPVISGTDGTAAADYAVFGNLQNYALGIKMMPESLTLNPWAGTEFKQNQVLFRMYMRAAGAPIFEDMFSLLSCGSAV